MVDRDAEENDEAEGLGMGNLVDVAYSIHEGLAGDLNGGDESEDGDLEPQYVLEPNLGKRYNEYKQKAEEKLYPSCEAPITILSAVVDLQNLKKQYNWSGNCVTALLSMLRIWLPEGNTLPSKYPVIKAMLKDLGMKAKCIDACENNCMLYWKTEADLTIFPQCETPRYKVKEGEMGKKEAKEARKDDNHLAECSLRPRTLKDVLFSILSEQGNNGSKVSELAKAVRENKRKSRGVITAELEILICSTLSSDITLFENISPSGYRLRSNPLTNKAAGVYQSYSEDFGNVDGDSENNNTISSDESELDLGRTNLSIVKPKQHHTKKSLVMIECTKIDESNSGELWVLALMEGEYSDLSIEEKLNSLVALVDLTSVGSSIRVKEMPRQMNEKKAGKGMAIQSSYV
ncbi:hypothetical protein IFM89_002649 [Coptis chinensis]|uniref:WHIM1 domain-containing protein n=1 Tax=Coptis chinensis TaxID=261450 RepID=A0A835IJ16_9MAGN|nr:hypothetical protein IFM89_002649 [Coptis chinensis]